MNDSAESSARAVNENSRRRLPRVALVVASLEVVGGQSVAAVLLASALRAAGYEVTLLPVNPRLPQWLQWVRRFRGVRTLVNQMFYLPMLLRLVGWDVVHVFSASYWSFLLAPVPAMLAGRVFGKRVVLHYHSGEAADHLANWGWAVHPWLSLAHEIVVPSEYLGRIFAAHGYKTRVIANLLPASDFRFRERGQVRPVLLSTRNLEPYYSVSTTIRAFALVKARYPHATLTVVGFGSENGRLRELAETLGVGDTRFLGQVAPAQIPTVLEEADVFLNASVVDNQPLSILEAFAAGLPVVSTPTGAIGEMVRDGETGVLVPCNDPAAMAARVFDLVERPGWAAEMSRRARQELERYAWPAVGPAWAAVYVGAGSRGTGERRSTNSAGAFSGRGGVTG